MSPFPFHAESSVVIDAPADAVFGLLDDHQRLASHMTRSSWIMAGSSMTLSTDEAHGQAVGSKICLSGRILGIALTVEEVVTRREPPSIKTWETSGAPRLLVMGAYSMGFSIDTRAHGSLLRVFINYDLPGSGAGRWLGKLFGGVYARWCTTRMATDAAEHFRSSAYART